VTLKHIVMFSGGAGSWAAAKRVAAEYGTADMTLLFTDTLIEDEDNYRFLEEATANVGAPLVRLAEGRDPWQVFRDKRFLGNSRVDPCSRILKRELADKWIAENCDPADTRIYVGIDWTESHRIERLAERRKPWIYLAPMCEPPYMRKADVLAWLRSEGIQPPRLYAMGFGHANCGGFCIKAGQAHYANLLRVLPDRYAYHEAREEEFREYLGKDVSILRSEVGGVPHPLTLRQLRERLESNTQIDLFDWGGCGCIS